MDDPNVTRVLRLETGPIPAKVMDTQPTEDTRTLYAGMSSEELSRLHRAFAMDLMVTRNPETVTFAEGRIALIREMLEARKRK